MTKLADLDLSTFNLDEQVRCRVQGGDYSYFGWLVVVFNKMGGASRCVVEDDNGRLFIHRLEQIDFNLEGDK